MDLHEIEKLMTSMEKSGITKIKIKKTDGFELELEKGLPPQLIQTVAHQPMPVEKQMHHDHHHHQGSSNEKREEKGALYITSPMVGTFYASPGPDQNSFVKVGDRVSENTIVCIIEAMKVMNEIKAGKSGVIKEICAESGEPVEYGSNLFRIE